MGNKAWVGLALVLGMLAAGFAEAADWSIVPTVVQRSEFNSNLNYSFNNVISDYIFTLQPAAEFNYTTEITRLQGRLGLTGLHYLTHSELDHIDQNYQINARYQAAPRLNLSLNSTYISDSTLQEEILASGLVMSRTPRQYIQIGPGLTYNLTERLLGTISYNFNRVMYDDPDFINYTGHQAGLTFTYLCRNEKTTLINNNIIRGTYYPGGNDYKSLGFYAGVNHKFTERWDVNFMGGVNVSFYNFDTQVADFSLFPFFVLVKTQRIKSSDVTPYVSISTNYRWTSLTVSGGFSRDQSPSAYGGVYEVNRIYLSCGYNITERLRAGLSGSYYLSNISSQSTSNENSFYSISPTFTYQITEKMSVTPGYSYSGREDITGDQSAHTHMAWLQFSYTYPIHYQR